jgi:hypothetical protein
VFEWSGGREKPIGYRPALRRLRILCQEYPRSKRRCARTRDEGRSFEAGSQDLPSNRWKLLLSNSIEKFAAVDSITWSARASSVGGTVRPRILAVWALIDKLELARLHDRQVRRLSALEGSPASADVDAGSVRVERHGSKRL